MTKEEAKKKLARSIFERDEAIKALEEEKVDRKATKERIKKEAFDEVKE